MLRFFRSHKREKTCPHPDWRIRHIHGDERNYGYVAQCLECYKLFKDWPGGSHEATPCRNPLIEEWLRKFG